MLAASFSSEHDVSCLTGTGYRVDRRSRSKGHTDNQYRGSNQMVIRGGSFDGWSLSSSRCDCHLSVRALFCYLTSHMSWHATLQLSLDIIVGGMPLRPALFQAARVSS